MKITVAVILVCSLLIGCSHGDDTMKQVITLRQQLAEAEQCSFQTEITVDYSDTIYTFKMDCYTDSGDNLRFTVTSPESISGITGTLSDDGGALTFDDTVLAFPFLTQLQLSPVSSPWIFWKTLKSGYVTSYSVEQDDRIIYIDDSFSEKPLHLQIHVNSDMIPFRAEIICQKQRIMTLNIKNFTIM